MSSKVSQIREQAQQRREERQKIYQKTVSDCVSKVLKSDDGIMLLNMAASGGRSAFDNPSKMEQVVGKIATEVTRSITDSITNFEYTCKSRGLSNRRIRHAVSSIYNTYFEEFSKRGEEVEEVEYDAKLKAVADKLELEPALWEQLPALAKVE